MNDRSTTKKKEMMEGGRGEGKRRTPFIRAAIVDTPSNLIYDFLFKLLLMQFNITNE
jgi:hypothetical protein